MLTSEHFVTCSKMPDAEKTKTVKTQHKKNIQNDVLKFVPDKYMIIFISMT